jgi:hypothetical protein
MSGHHVVQRARLKWIMAKLAPKKYGNRPVDEASGQGLVLNVITGVVRADEPSFPGEPAQPKQITYQKPELPADLTEQDWSIMLEVLELVKRTVPTNDERPPEEIFGVMKAALLAHFRANRAVQLPHRTGLGSARCSQGSNASSINGSRRVFSRSMRS